MVNVTKISRRKLEQLEQSGAIVRTKPAQQPQPLPVTPSVDSNIEAAKEIAASAKDAAVVTAASGAQQLETVKSIIEQVSNQLREKGNNQDWTRLNIRFVRDKNNLLKSAEIEKVK